MSEEKKGAVEGAQKKMDGLEDKLSKQAENLPKLSKESVALVDKSLPWVAGVFMLLSLYWVKDLWDILRAVDGVNSVGDIFGTLVSSVFPSKTNLWVGIALFALIAIFIGMAFAQGLTNKTKASWNYLFYGMISAVVAGVWYLFFLSELSSGRAFLVIVVGLGGLYGLFQVRSLYKK